MDPVDPVDFGKRRQGQIEKASAPFGAEAFCFSQPQP
jgi:hypothetical protein